MTVTVDTLSPSFPDPLEAGRAGPDGPATRLAPVGAWGRYLLFNACLARSNSCTALSESLCGNFSTNQRSPTPKAASAPAMTR